MSQNQAVLRASPRVRVIGGLFVSVLGGCQDPLAELEPRGERVRVTLSDGAALDQVPSVFRLRLEPAPAVLDDVVLFQDELSSYYRGRVAAGELPDSLLERRVPMLAWSQSPGEAFAQPSHVLARGTTYSLALMGQAVLARIILGGDEAPVLERRWPRDVGGASGGVYCLAPAYAVAPFSVLLAPDEAPANFVPVEFAPECAELRVPGALAMSGAPGVRVPPPSAGGVLIDPAPLVALENLDPPAPAACAEPCVALGPGCLCTEDDRALIRGPNDPAFWMLNLEGRAFQGETDAELPLVVPELMPRTSYSLSGSVYDRAGRSTRVAAEFQTGAARPRLVINEVYANAAGAEPEQEWVELVNAGTLSTTLGGYVIEDVGGTAVLPDIELEANAYALVVNQSYAPEPDYDLVPPETAVLVVVERLGKSGLSNEGEALRLSGPDGAIVSRFPGLRAPEPGVSAARRTPWADDEAPDAFAPHGAPGASPGAPNFFDAAE